MRYCFPYPQNSDVVPLRAPYVATTQYTLGGPSTFVNFFINARAHSAELHPAANSTTGLRGTQARPRSNLASMIQSWLFFGLASEALVRNVAHAEFTERNAVGTSDLSIDIRIPLWFWEELNLRWIGFEDMIRTPQYERAQKSVKRCLQCTKLMLEALDLHIGEDTELGAVVLSVHMLLYVLSSHFGDTTVSMSSLNSASTQTLIQRMLGNGWCRKRLNFINIYQMFYPVLYFMSSFRPPHGKDDNHRLCTAAKCGVATGLLQPLHRTADCQCDDIHVPVDQVCKIVAANDIPLIRITRSSSGEIALEVVPYMGKNRFIAISHVWADRQFGSATNALPRCQVEYLDSVLATLPGKDASWHVREWCYKKFSPSGDIDSLAPHVRAWPLFWLDSFCIPQAAQHSDLRYRAINFMNFIYAAASQTLVFDSSLQNFNAGKQPMQLFNLGRPTYYGPQRKNLQDLLAHICASNWMGRAW
jgi:hypothetical protein